MLKTVELQKFGFDNFRQHLREIYNVFTFAKVKNGENT